MKNTFLILGGAALVAGLLSLVLGGIIVAITLEAPSDVVMYRWVVTGVFALAIICAACAGVYSIWDDVA